jgi:hypothetical protein
MGDVFLAELASGQTVALKRIRADLRADPTFIGHFEREARICAVLAHEHIVALEAYGRDDEGPYLALEYVEGCSVSVLTRACGRAGRQVPLDVARSIASDCASALRYAHTLWVEGARARGVIHRDLSPDNILVSIQGIAKLADFGLARIVGTTRVTQTGVAKGKFGYIAPEMYEGHEADALTDIFAFGATLYSLFCGVPPFQGKTEAEVMRATLLAHPPVPSQLRPGVPAAVDGWIHRALSKDRGTRPSGFSDLLLQAEDLRGAVARCLQETFPNGIERDEPGGEGAPHRVSTVAARHLRQGRGRRVSAAVALAGAVAAAAAGFGFFGRRPTATAVVLPAAPAPVLPKPVPVEPVHDPSTPPAQRPRAKAPRTQAKSAPQPAAPTRLWIRVQPWAHVFVDGEALGTTPLAPFEVSAGPHTVILVNDELHIHRSLTVEARAHQTTEWKTTLTEEPARLQDP